MLSLEPVVVGILIKQQLRVCEKYRSRSQLNCIPSLHTYIGVDTR